MCCRQVYSFLRHLKQLSANSAGARSHFRSDLSNLNTLRDRMTLQPSFEGVKDPAQGTMQALRKRFGLGQPTHTSETPASHTDTQPVPPTSTASNSTAASGAAVASSSRMAATGNQLSRANLVPNQSHDVSEQFLLRDLVFVLQGINGTFLQFQSSLDRFAFRSDVTVPPSVHSLTLRIAEAGWLYKRVGVITALTHTPCITEQTRYMAGGQWSSNGRPLDDAWLLTRPQPQSKGLDSVCCVRLPTVGSVHSPV